MQKKKIVSLEAVRKITGQFKTDGEKVVLCHGSFSLLHIGHIRYLKKARNYGDIVVVSIIADKFVKEKDNFLFDEKLRAETVASFEWVDFVVINPFDNVYDFIRDVKPDIFLKGFESKENDGKNRGKSIPELERIKNSGVEVVVVPEDNFTSTSQINRYLVNMSEDIQKYIHVFKQRYSIDALMRTIENMKDIRVLIIGDTILDEYHYCSAIGKSSKDPVLALKYESHDLFAGGVLAVANHTAGFCDNVDLITFLGEKDSHEEFIRSKLRENVRPTFIFKTDAPTLIKRRIIDGYSMNKLLEIYVMDDSVIEGELDREFYKIVESKLPKYDIVMAADFGHGAINMNLKKLLCQSTGYLAVNAQSNAGNRGFNNITKYPRADYIAMAEHEIRLEMRDLTGKIRPMMDNLIQRMDSRTITVTRGRKGCMILDREGNFVQVPSFTHRVVDRVGAGDALFSVTSLAAMQNAPCELIGFLGNVAGSLAVGVMGNQKFINNNTVIEYINNLLQ